MGRDMDQNHGKHAKGHLLHLRIFIKAPQAAAQQPKAGASIRGGGNCPPDFVRIEVAARQRRRGAHSQIWLKNVQKVHVLRFLKFFFRWVPMLLENGN